MLLGVMALVLALSSTTTNPDRAASARVGATPDHGLNRSPGMTPTTRSYRGALDFPSIRTASYWQNSRTSGTELATIAAPPQDELRLTLMCPGARRSTIGRQDLSVQVHSHAGACIVVIASASASRRTVPFHVTLDRAR